MGYEVSFKYYELKENNGFDFENEKEFKVKIGDPFEVIELEKLAGSIMSQFARRDIYVFDADVVELSRKQINFKQTKGGIILKNKKYTFEAGTSTLKCLQIESEEEENDGEKPKVVKKAPAKLNNKPPIRYEIYSPDKDLEKEAKARGFLFTKGKKYPIYEERPAPVGYFYITVDDTEKKFLIHANHFVPETKGLSNNFLQEENNNLVNLDYGNVENMPMPNLRR